MAKWSQDDSRAKERLKDIAAAGGGLRGGRQGEPPAAVEQARDIHGHDVVRAAKLRRASGVATGDQKRDVALVRMLTEIAAYCGQYRKTSRVAARVAKMAEAALAVARRR